MKEDEKETYRKCLEVLQGLREIIIKTSSYNCESCEEKKKTVDKFERCEYLVSLQKDYKAIFDWAFGSDNEIIRCRNTAREVWTKRHPNLPLPRILMSEETVNPGILTICLITDIYPFYLKRDL